MFAFVITGISGGLLEDKTRLQISDKWSIVLQGDVFYIYIYVPISIVHAVT